MVGASLPVTMNAIQTRLQALAESLKQTQQLITRLSKLSPQPGSTSSVPEEDRRVELGEEIHESLKEQEADFELLRQDAEDFADRSARTSSVRRVENQKDQEKIEIAARVAKTGEDLKM